MNSGVGRLFWIRFCPEGRDTFYPFISPIWARYFLLSAQEKVPKEKGTPVHSSAIADPFRSSPIRGRAQLAISLCSIRSDRVRA